LLVGHGLLKINEQWYKINIMGDMRTESDSLGPDDQHDADYSCSTHDLLPFRALDKNYYCLIIKFLALDWQSRFRSIKPSELRVAMILTLLKCPNHACATKHFSVKILHLLKVRTNRSPKEEFSDKVNKQVDWFAKKGIIQNYKSTNDRVKLENSYKYFLKNSLPHVIKAIATDNDIVGKPSAHKEPDVEGFEREEIVDTADLFRRIPDLPPAVDESDAFELENADTEKRSDEADTADLLENLFNDTEGQLSKPLLDRIDLKMLVSSYDESFKGAYSYASSTVKKEINAARVIQQKRFRNAPYITCNANVPDRSEFEKFEEIDRELGQFLKLAYRKLKVSTKRMEVKVILVARTIADLAGDKRIKEEHIEQAVDLMGLTDSYFRDFA